jgi:hypothetical protein
MITQVRIESILSLIIIRDNRLFWELSYNFIH